MKTAHSIIGVVTVNDKGQVVIPADTRTAVGITSGDKLLVLVNPNQDAVVLNKARWARSTRQTHARTG